MTSKLEARREELYDALKPLLPEGRVTKYVPAQVVAPCMWIEAARVATNAVGAGGLVMTATFPIVGVVDGSQQNQAATTDEITARMWDAAELVVGATVQDAEPSTLDVGGPELRAVTVNVAVPIRGRGLCLPTPPLPDP